MLLKKPDAGALTRDDFERAFNDAPELLEIPSPKALEKRLVTYLEYSNNPDRDYKVCNKVLVDIRSILKHSHDPRSILLPITPQLHDVLIAAIKDKRSAVMHEGCFTVAMFVKTFANDVLTFALEALDLLIPYSQTSIRVMSSSATIAANYICQSVRSPKIFTNLLDFMRTSKSRFVRGAVMELVQVIADSWPEDALRKASQKLRELVDLGVVDAGPSAREAAREATNCLNKKMPDLFQPQVSSRPASRPMNFYANRAATDMSSRMLSAKRANMAESRVPARPKFSATHNNGVHSANITMRSRTPNATSTSKANSQPGSRQGSPTRGNPFAQTTSKIRTGTVSAQPRRMPEANKELRPITPPKLTPKRSPAPRPNVVPAAEAYARAHMSRDALRHANNLSFEHDAKSLSFDASFGTSSTSAVGTKTNGVSGPPPPTNEVLRSKSTNDASVPATWKTTLPNDLRGNTRAQTIYLNAVLDAIALNDRKNVPSEAETALTELAEILRADVITVWDTYFNPLFAKVVDVISVQTIDAKTRCAAAHCLVQLIKNSRGISTKCPMLVNRLIEVQISSVKDLALNKAIENCTIELARSVDLRTLLPILKNIIKAPEQSSQKCAAAVKIISHAISRLQESEALEQVDSIVPMVFQLYESSSESSVRRDCVICLVVFNNKVGMPLIRPFISNAMEKLIDVYGKRHAMADKLVR